MYSGLSQRHLCIILIFCFTSLFLDSIEAKQHTHPFYVLSYTKELDSQQTQNENLQNQKHHSFLQHKITEGESDLCYSVVFDAGSSGTKYDVFQWNCAPQQNGDSKQLVNIKSIKFYKDSFPISDYYQNPDGLVDIFEQKFKEIKEVVPEQKISSTDIFLAATEGMRQISLENQQIIISQIQEIFSKSGFRFQNSSKASVITGQQEGIYLWFSINYMLKVISKESDILNSNTVTTIDIGGKSAQLSYLKKHQELTSLEESYQKQISSQEEYVFVASSDKLGFNYARYEILKQQLSEQVEDNQENDQIVNSSCFNKEYEGVEEKINLQIRGSGDPIDCINQIRKFLKIEHCLYPKKKDCSKISKKEKVLQVPSDQTLYASDSSMYAREAYGLPEEYDPFELRQKAISFCKKQYSSVSKNATKYTHLKCIQGLYVSTLLIDHFGVKKQKVNSPSKINTWQPSWGIGFLFFEISNLNCNPNDNSLECHQIQELQDTF